MAIGATAGRNALLTVSDDGGATYVNVGGIVDVGLNISVDELECTSHDSIDREYLPNFSDLTLDVSMRWIDGDAGQEVILTSVFAKTTFLFKFTMETGSGKKLYSGTAFPTATNPNGPLDDTGSMDSTLRCSSVTQGTQP